MLKNLNMVNVPYEERTRINSIDRQRLFAEIYKMYTKIYGLKLVYAFLNNKSVRNNSSSLFEAHVDIDYFVIYKARNDYNTADLILYDAPPIFSDRCIPSYNYYKKIGKRDNFFKYGIDEMVILEKGKFYEFLQLSPVTKFSINKNDTENYWKNPANGYRLGKALSELSMQYLKKQ